VDKREQLALLDHQVLLAGQVQQAGQVRQVKVEVLVLQALQVDLDPQEELEQLDLRDLQDAPVQQAI